MVNIMVESPVIEGLIGRVQRAKDRNLPPQLIAQYEKQLATFQKGLDPKGDGRHIVWSPGGGGPGAVMECFKNLNHFNVTGYGYLAGVWGFASRYIDIADKAGFNRDTCSSVRVTIGVALSGEVPPPELVLASSLWCENFRPWSFVAAHYGVPMYEVECPQPYYDKESAVAYQVKDYERFIRFMEEMFDQKLDRDELDRRVKARFRAAEVSREINVLRQAVPTPIKGRDAMRLYVGWDGAPASGGDEGGHSSVEDDATSNKALKGLMAMRDAVKAKVEKGDGVVPEEKYRLIWCQTPPFYTDLTGYMEKEHGAVCVFNDPHKQIWWEEGEFDGLPPLEALARMALGEPWGGPGTRRIEGLVQNAKDYKADGIIFFKSWGCRVAGVHGRQLQEAMLKEVGIPVLILDEDYVDADNYSDEETKTKLDSFIYMME